MITHIKFVSVPVVDQSRALEFYTKKLGFTLESDEPMNETQRWIELRVANSQTRLVLFAMDNSLAPGAVFNGAFASSDVQKTYDELKARGVEFLSAPQIQPWGTFCTFKDSEGNQFVLGSA